MLREQFFGEAPAVRCAATAACRPGEASGDSSGEVLTALRDEGYPDLELSEVEAVIRVWNLNAYDSALAPLACKVSHSCSPNVSVCVDAEVGAIEAIACRSIAAGDSLGSWYFQDTGLWWMGADVRRAIFETDRGFLCGCLRCQGPDKCRALPCDACGEGKVIPNGCPAGQVKVQPTWSCCACHSTAAGDVRVNAETELVPRVLLELRPPRGSPKASAEELVALAADVRTRLGLHHWAAAAVTLVLHIRVRPPGGSLDPFSAACGTRFLGWLQDLNLPTPPAGIVRTPISVAMECAAFLGPVPGAALNKQEEAAPRPKDGRCIAARILRDFLLPIYRISGAAVAKVAKTSERVEALQFWLKSLQSTCGRCGTSLVSSDGANVAVQACGRCKQVRYCGRECQQADWKDRHKACCLPSAESLAGESCFKIISGI